MGDEIRNLKLVDSREPLQSTFVPQIVRAKPNVLSPASQHPFSTNTSVISGTFHSTELSHPEFDPSAIPSASSTSSLPRAVRSDPRQRHKVSNSTAIPTALVTPLPGTSPPHYTHAHNDPQPVNTKREEMDFEDETRLKGGGWRFVERGDGELHGLPVVSGDDAVELIEKWKALIDTKDRIMKQKNVQIERYINIHCTCMHSCII